METYSDYLQVLKKMEQIQKLLLEMKDKKISEISEEKNQYLQNLSVRNSYDQQDQIGDLYFVDADDVFSLLEELGEAEMVTFTHDHLEQVFCLSFFYRWDEVRVVYADEIEKTIEQYRTALELYKVWEDEDNQEDEDGRFYNVLVIQESNRNYYLDSKTGEHIYCWERQETIKTDYYKKLYQKAEEIYEKASFDYFQNKIFIDLDTGEEIILWDNYGYETEATDRATFFLEELSGDE